MLCLFTLIIGRSKGSPQQAPHLCTYIPDNSNIHIDMVLNHLGTDVLGAGNVSEHISYINWHHVKGQNYHKVNQNYRTHLSKIFFPVKRYQNNYLRWTLIGLLGFCIHPLKKFLSEKTFGSLPRF